MATCPHGYVLALPGFLIPPPSALPHNFFDVATRVLRRPLREVEDPDAIADVLLFCLYGSHDHWPREFDALPSLELCKALCDWCYERNRREEKRGDEREAVMEYIMEEMSRMGWEPVLPRVQGPVRREAAGPPPAEHGQHQSPGILKGGGGKDGGRGAHRGPGGGTLPRGGGKAGTRPPRGDGQTGPPSPQGGGKAGTGPPRGGAQTGTTLPQGGGTAGARLKGTGEKATKGASNKGGRLIISAHTAEWRIMDLEEGKGERVELEKSSRDGGE